MLLLHHDFKWIYLHNLCSHLFTLRYPKSSLHVDDNRFICEPCLKKKKKKQTFDLTMCKYLLPLLVLLSSLIHCKPCTFLKLPIILSAITIWVFLFVYFCFFFCTQFQMSSLVVMSWIHIFCIKHSFKHLSTYCRMWPFCSPAVSSHRWNEGQVIENIVCLCMQGFCVLSV